MSPTAENRSRLFQAVRWMVVCWVVVFWRLDYLGLVDDAAHYAQLTREMLRHRSWLVPLLDGAPYIDKPVLFHWLQGLFFATLGEHEWSARLPSALAAVALFAATRQLGQRFFATPVAERAWLMLATIPATFVLSRVGYLDMTFAFLLFSAVGCLWTGAAADSRRLRLTGCALLALATMTKGPVALVLAAGVFGLAWLVGGEYRRTVRAMDWPLCAALALMGAAPWFVWMHGRFGDTFLRDYFLAGHLWYLAPRQSASSNASAFYLEMFVTVFFPWSLVTLGYFIDTARRWRAGHRPPASEGFLWLWIVTVIVLFTVAKFRVDRYIYPAAPACCLLAARAWLRARDESDRSAFVATRLSILLLAIVLTGAGILIAVRLPSIALQLSPVSFGLPVVLIAGGVTIAAGMLRRNLRPPVVLNGPIALMLAVYAFVVAFGLPALERARPIRQVGSWLQAQPWPADPIGLYKLDRWQLPLRYYANRPLRRLEDEEQAKAFLAEPGPRWLITSRENLTALGATHRITDVRLSLPAVVGTAGRGVRRQVWSEVVIVRTSDAESLGTTADARGGVGDVSH